VRLFLRNKKNSQQTKTKNIFYDLACPEISHRKRSEVSGNSNPIPEINRKEAVGCPRGQRIFDSNPPLTLPHSKK
jgi:hypothetical protein